MTSTRCERMIYSYNEIRRAILKRNVEMLIKYKDVSYWLTINQKACFGDSDGKISLIFSNPEELLNAVLIDNKTLADIWGDVEVESYENGWNRTVNS